MADRPTSVVRCVKTRAMRQDKSRAIVIDLEPWLREKLGLISQKTKLAEAIRYTLSRWEGLALP